MDILHARYDLVEDLAGFFFLKAPVFDYVLEKLTSGAVLHYQVKVFVVFDHLVELDYIAVTDFFQNGNFPVDPFKVRVVLDLFFLQNFYGYFFTRWLVGSLLYLTESALALSFSNYEFTNHFYFICVGLRQQHSFYILVIHLYLDGLTTSKFIYV